MVSDHLSCLFKTFFFFSKLVPIDYLMLSKKRNDDDMVDDMVDGDGEEVKENENISSHPLPFSSHNLLEQHEMVDSLIISTRFLEIIFFERKRERMR